jgi:hypothetical protein
MAYHVDTPFFIQSIERIAIYSATQNKKTLKTQRL